MNIEIIKDWIVELKAFAKMPTFKHLAYPMAMDSVEGELYSPLGIICNVHSGKSKVKWMPEKGDKLRNFLTYGGSLNTPPKVVSDWVGVKDSFWSQISRVNSDDGFSGVIKYLEKIIEEKHADK